MVREERDCVATKRWSLEYFGVPAVSRQHVNDRGSGRI